MDLTTLTQYGLPGVAVGALLYVAHQFMAKGYTIKIELGPRKRTTR
jgi:hypothetical protein